MLSISIGPLEMSVSMITTIVGIFVFWAITHWLLRNSEEKSRAVDGFFTAIMIGFVVARIVFVIKLWPEYQQNLWQLINIRDGGFIAYSGWMAGILVLVVSSSGRRAINSAYLKAGVAALCVVIPLHYAAVLNSSGIVIPEIPVRNSNGEKVNLQTFKGKPVVINYWATWCPPCRKEMPVLQAAQKKYSAVEFLFVNQGEDLSKVQHYLQSQGLKLNNVFYDPASQLSRASGAAGLPTTLFFEASGKLAASHMGELSNASLAHYLQMLEGGGDN
jgi:thiol-disulfide isomerase/thioredoxin